jgi:hypothetical protein
VKYFPELHSQMSFGQPAVVRRYKCVQAVRSSRYCKWRAATNSMHIIWKSDESVCMQLSTRWRASNSPDCSLSANLINQMRSSAIALFSALITTFEVAKVNITGRWNDALLLGES